jgi:hypothetical protein
VGDNDHGCTIDTVQDANSAGGGLLQTALATQLSMYISRDGTHTVSMYLSQQPWIYSKAGQANPDLEKNKHLDKS